MASDNAKISKGYSSKQSFARRRARAPKGNRLRAAGARGEPILTSRAIRRGAENCRRTYGRAEEACASSARSLRRCSTLKPSQALGVAERPRTLAGDRYLRLRLAGHLACRLCAPGHCGAVSVGLAGPVTPPQLAGPCWLLLRARESALAALRLRAAAAVAAVQVGVVESHVDRGWGSRRPV